MSQKTFDYVIVGGGTAGLVVAARLAERDDTTVCVLEAGKERTQDPDMSVPGFAAKSGDNADVNWLFRSSPQKLAGDRAIDLPSGKVLGGSSMINFMMLCRGHKEEYDAFETLGNPGWGWSGLLEYFKKSETFTVSPSDTKRFDVKVDSSVHGTNGPIHRTMPKWVSTIAKPFRESLQNLGVSYNSDPFSGNNVGVSMIPMGIDPVKATRSSSASAYYEPIKSKKNLTVLTDCRATRITFSSVDAKDMKIADGVEVIQDGQLSVVKARREVILSAGSYQTPQLLELSGIGDPEILKAHDITPIIELPGDHIFCPYVAEMSPEHESLGVLADPERAASEWKAYQESGTGMLSAGLGSIYAFLPLPASSQVDLKKYAESEPGVHKIQEEWLRNGVVPQIELTPCPAALLPPNSESGIASLDPAKSYYTIVTAVLHPFSRGSVHITSNDPLSGPLIDLGALSDSGGRDCRMMCDALRYARNVGGSVGAGAGTRTGERDEEELEMYVRKSVQSVHHPVGTAGMLPRSEGGVVDGELRVYGCANLRVIDASVIPVHVSAHTQMTVIAVAEKGADIVKAAAA